MTQDLDSDKNKKRTIIILFSIVVLMFGFAFALVPLYNLFCKVTGYKAVEFTQRQNAIESVNKNRMITIKFDSTVHSGLPWEFYPVTKEIKVYTGKVYTVKYLAKNLVNEKIHGQTIPAVSPWQAGSYFNKTECFCFSIRGKIFCCNCRKAGPLPKLASHPAIFQTKF